MADTVIKKTALIDIKLQSEEARSRAADLRAALERLKKEIKELTTTLNDANEVLGEEASETKKLADELVKLETQYKLTRQELGKYHKEMNKGQEVFKKTGGLSKSIASAMGKMALRAAALVISFNALKSAVKAAVSSFAEFESTLTNVQTLMKRNNETLGGGALAIMREYGFKVKDVNKALFDTISAGVPAGESIEFLHQAARLSIGGVTDLTTAVKGLVFIMNAYSTGTKEAANIADAFYTAQKYGVTTVQELVEHIGRIVPVAQIANVSYQQMLSTLALLTKGGLKTEESVTILRQAIAAITKPAEGAAAIMTEFEIPVGMLAFRSVGLTEALWKLNAAFKKYPDVLSKMIPNIRAFTGVAALNATRLEELVAITGEVLNDHESLTRGYNEQMATLRKQWEITWGTFRTRLIQVGSYAKGPLVSALRAVRFALDNTVAGLEKEGVKVQGLVTELGYLGTSYERRLELINILKDLSPDIVKGLNAESINYELLKGNLKEYNDELANRIILENLSQDQEAAMAKFSTARDKRISKQVGLQSTLTGITEKYENTLKAVSGQYDNVDEQYAAITAAMAEYIANAEEQNSIDENVLNTKLAFEDFNKELEKDMKKLNTLRDKENKLQQTSYDVSEKLLKIREALEKPSAEDLFIGPPEAPDLLGGERSISIADRNRLLAAQEKFDKQMAQSRIAIMREGLEKSLAAEELANESRMEEMEKSLVKGKELAQEELAHNAKIKALMLQQEKLHFHNVNAIWVQYFEDDKDRQDKAAAKEIATNEAIAQKLLGVQRRLENSRIAIMEEGLDKQLAQESQRFIIASENLNAIRIEGENLSEQELAFNRVISELQQQNLEENTAILMQIWDDYYKWLADEEQKAADDRDVENKKNLQLRKKYGLDNVRKQLDMELAAFNESEFAKTLTSKEQEAARDAIRREYYESWKMMAIDTAKVLSDSLFELGQRRTDMQYNRDIESADKKQEAELDLLKEKFQKGLIFENEYNSKTAAINKKFEAEKRALDKKKFEDDRDRDFRKAIMNGVLAISKTFVQYGFTPAGWAAAAIGAAQTAIIAATIKAQNFAKGGRTGKDKGWNVRGKGTSYSDSIPARLSYGEAVINARSMRDPSLRAAASAINQAGGGVAFADGGMLGRNLTGKGNYLLTENGMAKIMRRMPRPVVQVVDILDVADSYVEVTNRADI